MPFGRSVDGHEMLDAAAVGRRDGRRVGGERGLGEEHAGPAVGEHVLDVLARVGRIQGDRHHAELHRGGVDARRLEALAQHERDRVAAAQAEGVQARGDAGGAIGIAGPRQGLVVAHHPQRGPLGIGGHGRREGVAQGGAAEAWQRRRGRLGKLDGLHVRHRRARLDASHQGASRRFSPSATARLSREAMSSLR